MNSLDTNPFETAHLVAPHGFQRALQEAGPVVWLPDYQVYATGHYAVVKAVLSAPATFTSGEGVSIQSPLAPAGQHLPHAEAAPHTLHPARNPILEVDPPHHTVVRQVVEAVLPAGRIRQIAHSSAVQANRLLDHLAQKARFDAVADFSLPLALGSFPDSFGMQTSDRGALVALGELAMNSLGPRNLHFFHSAKHAGDLKRWMAEHLAPERLAPGSIGQQLWTSASATMDAAQAQDLVNTVLVSGVDTTLSALSTTLHCLAAHPPQWQQLRAQPNLVGRAFEEALRLEAPIQMCYRTVATATCLAGEKLERGRKIMLHLGAACRDARVYPAPEAYDLQREQQPGLAFGAGIHRCLGRAIAHAIGQAVTAALLPRISALHLLEPATYTVNNTLRRPAALWLAPTAA